MQWLACQVLLWVWLNASGIVCLGAMASLSPSVIIPNGEKEDRQQA